MAQPRGTAESNDQFYERVAASLTNKTPTPQQIERIEDLRVQGKRMAGMIATNCPSGRMRSLAATKLEETVMWAVKAIVLEGED